MAYQKVGTGQSANDGTGDDLRTGAGKINANIEEVYAKINGVATNTITDGTAITTDSVALLTATQTLTNKTLTAPTIGTSLDMNGGQLILDADADTHITADTDDQIDIAFGGNDRITLSSGLIDLKNDGTQSELRMYCESSNAHYAALQAPAHADFAGNITITMPSTTDTLVGRATTDTLTNKTLTSPTITGGTISNGVLTTPQINDTSADHQYVFAVSELAADRTVTLPLLAGDDEFVFKDHIQTLTNKTLTSATLTGLFGSVQSLSGAGAVDLVNTVTEITTTGADALTLANGTAGQVKIITMIADGGDGTLTPTTLHGGTTITFDDVGESVVLVYHNTIGWKAVSVSGATIA
jgi:hypothetical protein